MFACSACKFTTVKHDMLRSHCSSQHKITLPINKFVAKPIPPHLLESANVAIPKKPIDEGKKSKRGRPKKLVSSSEDMLEEDCGDIIISATVDNFISCINSKNVASCVVDTENIAIGGTTMDAILPDSAQHYSSIANKSLIFTNTLNNNNTSNNNKSNNLILETSTKGSELMSCNDVLLDNNGIGRVILGTIGPDGVLVGTDSVLVGNGVSSSSNSASDGSVLVGDLVLDEHGNFTLLNNSALESSSAPTGMLSYSGEGNVGSTAFVLAPSSIQRVVKQPLSLNNKNGTASSSTAVAPSSQNFQTVIHVGDAELVAPAPAPLAPTITNIHTVLTSPSPAATSNNHQQHQQQTVFSTPKQQTSIVLPDANTYGCPSYSSFCTTQTQAPGSFIIASKINPNEKLVNTIQVKKVQKITTARTRKTPPARSLPRSPVHPVIVATNSEELYLQYSFTFSH